MKIAVAGVLLVSLAAAPAAHGATVFVPGQDQYGLLMESLALTVERRANGGLLHSGIGVTLPFSPDAIASAKLPIDRGSPDEWYESEDGADLIPNGAGALIELAADLRTLFVPAATGPTNVSPEQSPRIAFPIVLTICLHQPVDFDVGAHAEGDIFRFLTNDRSSEVHLPHHPGSARFDGSRYNTQDDLTTLGGSNPRHFRDQNRIPFAFSIPDSRGVTRRSSAASALAKSTSR